MDTNAALTSDEVARAEAVRAVEAQHGWCCGVLAYVMVNALLVVVWAVSGAEGFWPIWPLLGWGIGLAFKRRAFHGGSSRADTGVEREMALRDAGSSRRA